VARQSLFRAIETTLQPRANRQLIRLPLHINDPAFAAAVVAEFRRLHGPARPRKKQDVTQMSPHPDRTHRDSRALPRHDRLAASRSSAAARGRASPPNARKPAASTSS
jgi:hypothetical protein